jgi:hypothetical protein
MIAIGMILWMSSSIMAQMDVAAVNPDVNMYLTNSEGEKVFSYNNKESLFVKLVAMSLNADPSAREIIAGMVLSDMEPEGETIMLQETDKNSGVFMGELKFKKSPMPFKNSKYLEVADGDKITATYLIGKDAQGVEDRAFDNAYYNGPDWVFQNTGESHIILLHPEMKITIDGKSAEPGVFVSVFYEKKDGDKTILENAGGTGRGVAPGGVRWMGKVNTVAAWGAQDGKNNGLAEGEKFKWKIWNPKDGKEYDATATYMTEDPHITHTDSYTNNGISGVIKLEAKSQK